MTCSDYPDDLERAATETPQAREVDNLWSGLASGQSAASGINEEKRSLPLNTVNQILTQASRAINAIEFHAKEHVEQLGQRQESAIRQLAQENRDLKERELAREQKIRLLGDRILALEAEARAHQWRIGP